MSVQLRSYLHSYLSYNESGEIMNLSYQIDKDEHYDNVLHVLKEQFFLSDRLITKLKKANKIYLNSLPTYTKKSVTVGDTVSVLIDFEEDNSNIVASNIPLNIIYEDEHLLVLYKPAGVPVQSARVGAKDCESLVKNYLYEKNPGKGAPYLGIVHRLDQPVEGLVLFALTQKAA